MRMNKIRAGERADLKTVLAFADLLLLPAVNLPAMTDTDLKAFLNGLPARIDMSQAHVSVVDMRDPENPVRAGFRDTDIVPAASIPKG